MFWKTYYKRSVICFFIIILLFLSCILRLFIIINSDYKQVYLNQNRIKLTAGNLRGTIFDCNMIPFTNSEKEIVAAVSPTPKAITAISSLLEPDELTTVLEKLKSGKPVLCKLPKKIQCDGVYCTTVYNTSSNILAPHIIGYINNENKGLSGIQKAYDSILFSEKKVNFYYEISAKGQILEGITPQIENDTSVRANGVVTTLDIKIQNIIEKTANHLGQGAIIVCESNTGKIRGCVSRPNFDITQIEKYLNKENSPLLNRATNRYNVGSVFKPCVAAAGIENNNGYFMYNCTGNTLIADRYFNCHNHSGHEFMNLTSAIANSCNTYFYNFSFKVGGEKIYDMAASLKFNSSIKLCENFSTVQGNLPKKSNLNNPANLANFSIGQGELLLSPISILNLYNSIALGGKYYSPYLVEATVKNGVTNKYKSGNPIRVMKSSTADIIKKSLLNVITDGTGKNAQPNTVSAAGKTATAQTGKSVNNEEIYQGWFCGFFPYEKPKYTIIVFSENTKTQTKSCAEIFAQTADEITALEK